MKFIIMTSPAFGNNFLKEILVAGLRPEFVVTTSPYYVSKSNLIKYPVLKIIKYLKFFKNRGELEKKYQSYFLAKKNKIPVFASHMVNTKLMESKIKAANIDYVFTFIFRILKPNIFSAPKIASINFHPSDLPLNRGATPWNWIISQQKSHTKISFHFISKDIDAGKIIKQIDFPIPKGINSRILREFMFDAGSNYFVKLIFELKNNQTHNLQDNSTEQGSYEKPFDLGNASISETMKADRIISIIEASRDSFHNAQFMFQKERYHIVQVIELNNFTSDGLLPERNDEGDILINTVDNRTLLLITNKTNLQLK